MALPTLLLLLHLLFQISLQPFPSVATDRLRCSEFLSANSTLTSSTGAFALGFFCPSASISRCYLGIWRDGSATNTAIWVANRASPVPLSSPIFRLADTSNLEVADSNGTVHWSTGIFTTSSASDAVLLDNGNLILSDGSTMTLWQSFDHATDTIVPGTAIWVNYRIHTAATAVSWKSPKDRAPGNFTLSLDSYTRIQAIAFSGARRWWRSNVWKGVSFTGLDLKSSILPFISFSSSPNPDWWNFSFTQSSLTSFMSTRVEYNGRGSLRLWLKEERIWLSIYNFTDGPCSLYAPCGPFAYCNASSQPKCRCLEGFEPQKRMEWEAGRYDGGCVRSEELACGEGGGDGFVKYWDMKLPDYNIHLMAVRSGSECQEVCRSNCSCMAYAYADLWTGSDGQLPRCLVWLRELVDVVFNNDTSGKDLYVKVRIASGGTIASKDSKLVIVIVPVVCCGFILILALAWLAWRRKKNQCLIEIEEGERFQAILGNIGGPETSSHGANGRQDLAFLVSATDNFSDLNMIGQGGFGKVYKGKLPRGREVAIKKLSNESHQGLEEFVNEVAVIVKLQHRNLVKLLYFCIHGDERLLVYEYMLNKSLELFLFDDENERVLNWDKRFSIIKGVARGLLYLHEESRLKVIHRDLKTSNILLDADMNPRISDFGMARIFGGNQNEANTRRIVGTYGYISPEYAMEGTFSAKSDVYSFGVLLLEIITGKRNNNNIHSLVGFPSLLSYAWELWSRNNQMDMLAPTIRDCCSSDKVTRCIHIGLLCVQDDLNKRPTMSSVVFLLENEAKIRTNPEKPNFTGWTFKDGSTQQAIYPEAVSMNHLTVTVLEGK